MDPIVKEAIDVGLLVSLPTPTEVSDENVWAYICYGLRAYDLVMLSLAVII